MRAVRCRHATPPLEFLPVCRHVNLCWRRMLESTATAADDLRSARRRSPGAGGYDGRKPAVADPKTWHTPADILDAATKQPTFGRINVVGSDGHTTSRIKIRWRPDLHRLEIASAKAVSLLRLVLLWRGNAEVDVPPGEVASRPGRASSICTESEESCGPRPHHRLVDRTAAFPSRG